MHTPFNDLSDSTRVWIYQSNTPFSIDNMEKIELILKEFLNSWNNHGEGLKSSFIIKHKQFIILAVDENHHEASGCSIDSSVQVMKKIEKECNVSLLDRMNTAFKIDDVVNVVSLADFQKYVNENKINSNTIVFNNMVGTIADFNSKWEVAAKESWHKRYFV